MKIYTTSVLTDWEEITYKVRNKTPNQNHSGVSDIGQSSKQGT